MLKIEFASRIDSMIAIEQIKQNNFSFGKRKQTEPRIEVQDAEKEEKMTRFNSGYDLNGFSGFAIHELMSNKGFKEQMLKRKQNRQYL